MNKREWTSGNTLELLECGEEFFPAAFAAIREAKKEIILETFIWFDDAVGQELQALLVDAASRGVQVDATVDGYGSGALDAPFIRTLTDAGVRLHASGLLCTLTEHAECGHGVVSAFRGAEGTDQLAKMLSLLLRAMICDPDEAVSRAVTTVLLTPLRERARGGRRVPSSDLTLTLTRAL